jgi:hypothetical protein
MLEKSCCPKIFWNLHEPYNYLQITPIIEHLQKLLGVHALLGFAWVGKG